MVKHANCPPCHSNFVPRKLCVCVFVHQCASLSCGPSCLLLDADLKESKCQKNDLSIKKDVVFLLYSNLKRLHLLIKIIKFSSGGTLIFVLYLVTIFTTLQFAGLVDSNVDPESLLEKKSIKTAIDTSQTTLLFFQK